MPAVFRRGLGEAPPAVVVTPLDQCLAAYPRSEWSRLEEQLRTLPVFSRPAKALTRLLTSGPGRLTGWFADLRLWLSQWF